MAELVNKFHVKDGNTVYECTSYTTTTEATPVVDGGDCWQIRNNGVTAYLGLWPTDSQETSEYSTPLTITKDNTEYYVETEVISMVTVTINQTDAHQTIHVLVNGTDDHTSTFDVMSGASYVVTVVPDTGYDAGTPNYSSGTISGNMTVSATASALQSFTVTITQIEHCTITVTCNNQDYTSSFTAYYGDTWTAVIVADAGYDAGTLEPGSSGTVTDNITITALDASVVTYTLTLAATANQTITLYYTPSGGSEIGPVTSTSSTQNFTVPDGTTWRASIAGNTGYNAGTLSPGASGTISGANTTVTADAAALQIFVLTLAATTNETLKIRYKARNADGTMPTDWGSEISSGSSDKTYNLRYGSTYQITSLTASTGWTAGSTKNGSTVVTPSTSTTYTMTAAITVSATAATHKTYTISLTQKTGETVTIYYKNHNGTSLASSWSTATASVTLGHDSQYYCTIAGSTYYTAGTITNAGSSSSPNTLTAAVTISFTAATHITYKITLTQKSNETVTIHYKNHSGSALASSWSTTTATVTLGKGSQYYSTIAGSTYYSAGTITSPGTSSSPNTLNAAVTISFTAATHITYTITLTQKSNETVTLHYKNHDGSELASSWSTATASKTLGKGSKYYSTIAASTGYTAGTITSPGSSSSPNTLNAVATISFTAATVNSYYLRFTSSQFEIRKSSSSGAEISSGSKVNYNQTVWGNHKLNYDHPVATLYKNSSASGTVWTSKTGDHFSFSMPASQVYIADTSYDDQGGSGDG